MKKEADVKARVKQVLKAHKAWYTMPFQAGYSAAGVPDFLVCWQGKFIGIETKFGSNKPTALQQRQLGDIMRAGGQALVINERNVNQLDELLRHGGSEV